MATTKKWYLSKTLWINVITLLLAGLAILVDQPWLPSRVVTVIVTLGLPVLNIALRLISGQPIGLPGAQPKP